MLVREIMNTNVKTIDPEATVQKAAKKMDDYKIGSLIVVKDGKLKGILTERDLLTNVVAQAKDASSTLVKNVMTKEVIMIGPDSDISDASEIMLEKCIKKLPVIEKNSLIGILTATDIVAAQPKMMEQLSSLFLMPGKKKIVAG